MQLIARALDSKNPHSQAMAVRPILQPSISAVQPSIRSMTGSAPPTELHLRNSELLQAFLRQPRSTSHDYPLMWDGYIDDLLRSSLQVDAALAGWYSIRWIVTTVHVHVTSKK